MFSIYFPIFTCHLKKVLALVLAFACAFTMFAGAAFTDSADIKVDTEVVDTLVALGVVNGYDDGSFKPNGTVTRAEMAKMIYVLRTGNSDASAYNDDKTSFTDIGSHWARGYIKYCQSLGIIAGKSNTKFCPNDKVTAQEAAKMLLVTLGYDATKAGLVGANWAAKTNALADENGLLEDVTTSFTAACPRQYAAQIIYNAVFAHTVVLRDGEYTNMKLVTSADKDADNYNPTIGKKYMGLEEATGELTKISYDEDKDEFTYTVAKHSTPALKSSKDYSKLYGLKVNVLYKTTSNKTTVYGIYAKDSSIVASGALNDLDTVSKEDKKIKIDGTEYKLSTETYNIGMTTAFNGADFGKLTTKQSGVYKLNNDIDVRGYYSFDLLDTDDDDKGDKIVVHPVSVEKVTYAGTKSINAPSSYKYEDCDIADGIAKDDYVVITAAANAAKGRTNIVKAEIVSGKVTATKDGKIQINNTWYNLSGVATNDFKVGDSYDVAVYNGYAFSSDATEEASKDILFVAGTKNFEKFAGENNGTVDAKAYFMDGSNKTITITKLDGDKLKATDYIKNKTDVTESKLAGKLYTYTVKGTDYELKTLNNSSNKAGYKDYADKVTFTKESGNTPAKIGTYAIADDAVVFVKDNSETKIVSGKTVNDWGADFGSKGQVLTSEVNGIKYAKVAALVGDARPSASGDCKYAYLTADTYNGQTQDEDADDALVFSVFGENGAKTLYDTDDTKLSLSDLKKGQLIQYTEDGDKIKDVKTINTVANSAIKRVAITGIEDKNKGLVYFLDSTTNGTADSLKMDDDVYFVKIDDAAATAEAGKRSEVAEAHSEAQNTKEANAYIAIDGGKIVAVYYDVDKLDDGASFKEN